MVKSNTFLWYCILCCTRGFNFSAGAWTPVLSHSIFLCLHLEGTNLSYHFSKIMILTWNTVFPRIIAGGNYFFFRSKRGRLLDGGDYLKYCSLEVVPSIFCYILLLNQKIITLNILMGSWLNTGFFQSIPSLVPWLIFRAWIITDQFCWVSLHFNLTGRIKGREDGERGRGGTIIRGRRFIRGDIRSALQQATYKKLEIYVRDWE